MATLLLQAAGAALGGLVGPLGATLGAAAGGLAGYWLDRALIEATREPAGRLAAPPPIAAEEGAALPLVHGTMRLSATLIWATRFEERKERQGAKGFGRREYRYYGNAAYALADGVIAGVRRVWADGVELDLTRVTMRVHRGEADQPPDPLILSRQKATPAYRGTAYAVFEGLPLTPHGNRLPQLQFEVMRPAGPVNRLLRAVQLIPGASEYGLSPVAVTQRRGEGDTITLNRHMLTADSDFEAALDELLALAPAVTAVALVVGWYGDDLRAGHCRIKPAVTDRAATGFSLDWAVSGISRAEAKEVSRIDGRPAYGGTPADATVVAAIRALKARGLAVTLHPLLFLDIPPGNGRPDPEGAGEQKAHPWRGRLTLDPAPGRPGSPDGTAAARTAIAAFCGAARTDEFGLSGDVVTYDGPAAEAGFRRFILSCAMLARAAGGVDGFLIGSELAGLTRLRDETGAYPFVEALARLAGELSALLGPATGLTYAADWTELPPHCPGDGSGDVIFHLDPLWAHPAISAVGLDFYPPLTDWRDEDWGGEGPDGATGPYQKAALLAGIAAGEGFDWYYRNAADRSARRRTPIADHAYGEPFLFRPKDLVGWWQNAHHDRRGGVRSAAPTGWVAAGKPIWLMEIGGPAVDKGPNAPHLFPDPKSAENGRPPFSDGGRADLAQARLIAAHLTRFDPAAPGHQDGFNPLSPVYGGRMVDPSRVHAWAWDLRPFPAFPAMASQWGDHANQRTGHWLNGRLSGVALDALIDGLLAAHGAAPADTADADGFLAGHVVDRPGSARAALEPLFAAFGLTAGETADGLVIRSERAAPAAPVAMAELVVPEDGPALIAERLPDHDLPAEFILAFRDPERDHQQATARAVEPARRGAGQAMLALPAALDPESAEALAAAALRRRWAGRDRLSLAVAADNAAPMAGAALRLTGDGAPQGDFLVTAIDDGLSRRLTLSGLDRSPPATVPSAAPGAAAPPDLPGPPAALLIDLPLDDHEAPAETRLCAAAFARPWRPQALGLAEGGAPRARLAVAATLGRLVAPLSPGVRGRLWTAGALELTLAGGELASVDEARLLNGANRAALVADDGGYELIQFAAAEEISAGCWRLTGLLRGQAGTAPAGFAAGSRVLVLDQAVEPAGLRPAEIGLTLSFRIAPDGAPEQAVTLVATGGVVAGAMFSPVHLSARRRADGGLALAWIRRGRIGADRWDGADIPLDAPAERYRVQLLGEGGTVLSEAETAEPALALAADQAPAGAFTLSVAQIGAAGPGAAAHLAVAAGGTI